MKWMDEINRLEKELENAINDAGGSPMAFDLSKIANFLWGAQQNSIDIYRSNEDGKLHVAYDPTIGVRAERKPNTQ